MTAFVAFEYPFAPPSFDKLLSFALFFSFSPFLLLSFFLSFFLFLVDFMEGFRARLYTHLAGIGHE